jgi:hypothetical protein
MIQEIFFNNNFRVSSLFLIKYFFKEKVKKKRVVRIVKQQLIFQNNLINCFLDLQQLLSLDGGQSSIDNFWIFFQITIYLLQHFFKLNPLFFLRPILVFINFNNHWNFILNTRICSFRFWIIKKPLPILNEVFLVFFVWFDFMQQLWTSPNVKNYNKLFSFWFFDYL